MKNIQALFEIDLVIMSVFLICINWMHGRKYCNGPTAFYLDTTLAEKGRLSGASRSEQMFEHISIISNYFRTFF